MENYGIFKDFIQFLPKKQLIVIGIGSYWIISFIFLILSILPIYGLMKRTNNDVSAVLRDALIVGQIFIGGLFLVAAFAFYSQFRYTQNKDKGIKTENIWQIDLGFETSWEKDYMPFIEHLKQSPYIEDVTTLTDPLFSSLRQYYCSYITRLPIQGEDDNYSDDNIVVVEPNFLSFFGLQMQRGEWLSDKGIPEYVINETGAKLINLENDFSRIYEITETDGQLFRISGIMKDYHYFPMQYPLEKTFFHTPPRKEKENLLLKTPYIYIKIKPEHEKQALEFTRKHYNDFSKDEVAPDKQIQYLPNILLGLNAADLNMSRIFLSLAIICILISSLGIYSLVALATKQRKKEIAIRKINGAKFPDILDLFLRRYLVLTVISNCVALPLGFLLVNRWLETYAYHFKLTIGLFVLVLLIIVSIVVFSVAQQVTRTVKMNEAEVVKSE
ncbi:MAG: FtsX-like permease family protein [Bacteroidetes bacterium ADurb.BinA174]|nr:MAG: FtsX-like permease family protein [Bacteroidetes bacterium ADurb.BinA174]